MEKLNIPNNDFIQKDINNESEIDYESFNKNEEKNKQSKNNYDQPASQEEISMFREEIEEKVENKAKDLKISKEKLIDLADFNLESLGTENLEALNLNKGELEFIKDGIDRAINEYWRNEKTDKLVTATPSSIDKLLKFVREHKKLVSLSELAIYVSSFGPAVLKDLAGDDVKVEIYGEKISLKNLVDNPELIKTIDRANNYNNPIDILADYSPPESFQYEDIEFSFFANDKINNDNSVEKIIYLWRIDGNPENLKKLNEDLEDLGISLKYEEGKDKGCSMDDFLENKDKIIDIFSEDLEIPKEKVEKYIESWLMPDVSNISVVEFEDFQINKDLKIPDDAMKLQQKQADVCEKYKIYSENGSLIQENLSNASKELNKWGRENGYENFNKALQEEKENYNKLPAVMLNLLEDQEKVEYENSENFKKIVIDVFEEEGYNVSMLKEIAKDNPEKVIEIISEVMGKNIKYDYIEAYLGFVNKDLGDKYREDKHSKGIPYITLESEKGVCHDYGITFIAVKNVLEEEGVSNLENFVSLITISGKHNHLWNAIVTVDPNNPDKIIVSYIDPTWDDSFMGKLNAVDKKHYYTNIRERINETHQKAFQKIKDYNILAFQEKLKEVLIQYDPKLYKREQKIEGNKRSRERNKDMEIMREEKTRNVKRSLKSTRNKLKKIYARKDSKNK